MRHTALFVVITSLLAVPTVHADDVADRLAEARLQADLGNHEAAIAALRALLRDPALTGRARGEAQVRLGLALRAAGDLPGSAIAFEKAMTEHADDEGVVRLVVQAVARVLPGAARWDASWRRVRLVVDRRDPARPQPEVVWPPRGGDGDGRAAGGRTYTGEPISLDFTDARLSDLFRLFADVTKLNVVVSPGIQGTVTLKILETPWDELLDRILAAQGLTFRVERSVLRIGDPAELAETRTYVGRIIDVDLRDEPIVAALHKIAQSGGVSARVDPAVKDKGTVSLVLNRVPWDQALDVVARVNRLAWSIEGGVVRVATALEPTRRDSSGCETGLADAQPCLVEASPLRYPDELRRRGIEGVVEMRAFVDAAGRVTEVQVDRSPDAELGELARTHVRQRQYRPARKAGKAVGAWMPVRVTFRLPRSTP